MGQGLGSAPPADPSAWIKASLADVARTAGVTATLKKKGGDESVP
jgi:hypothetical protein